LERNETNFLASFLIPGVPANEIGYCGALTRSMALFEICVFLIEFTALVECGILMAMIMESEPG
jgi:hypothetical protein